MYKRVACDLFRGFPLCVVQKNSRLRRNGQNSLLRHRAHHRAEGQAAVLDLDLDGQPAKLLAPKKHHTTTQGTKTVAERR